ncbi:hypothetical protein ACFQL4_28985 [Halosimplex aquaticum]
MDSQPSRSATASATAVAGSSWSVSNCRWTIDAESGASSMLSAMVSRSVAPMKFFLAVRQFPGITAGLRERREHRELVEVEERFLVGPDLVDGGGSKPASSAPTA